LEDKNIAVDEIKRIKNKAIHKINMAIWFFKHDARNKSMPGEKAQTKEDMNKNKNKQNQIAKELNKPLESLLSYIPKRVRMALSIAVVAGVSLFLPKPAYATDPLEIPSGAESFLVQNGYSYYSEDIPSTYNPFRMALFYIDTYGEAHPFAEQGYFVTNSGDTLWTQTVDTVYGEPPEEDFVWVITTKGVKVTNKDGVVGEFHPIDDSLFKKIEVKEYWSDWSDPIPLDTSIDYWSMDSTADVSIEYSGGGGEYWELQIAPPTDTIMTDDIQLRIIENGDIKPTNYETGLAYPNPFNSKVTIRTGDDRIGPVRIIDNTGKTIVTSLNGKGNEITWDASNFKSGKYYAVWKNKNGSYTITDLTLIK